MLVRVSRLRLIFCVFRLVVAHLSVLRAAEFVRNFDDGIVVCLGRASLGERFARQ